MRMIEIEMSNITLDDILTPLAITVIIDKKVRDPELSAFAEQGLGLTELFEIENVNESQIREWYKEHAPALKEKLSTKRRNTLVLRALTRFSEDIHIENVYDAMVAISVSDNEYHVEESDLIRSAASIWGFERPPLKVDSRKD
jgi:glycyl-tRNA synthetase alpha subunit